MDRPHVGWQPQMSSQMTASLNSQPCEGAILVVQPNHAFRRLQPQLKSDCSHIKHLLHFIAQSCTTNIRLSNANGWDRLGGSHLHKVNQVEGFWKYDERGHFGPWGIMGRSAWAWGALSIRGGIRAQRQRDSSALSWATVHPLPPLAVSGLHGTLELPFFVLAQSSSQSFFFFLHLCWSMIALQWCVSFCCITKWIIYTSTYIPYLLPLVSPSHPPYPTPLGGNKAPSWSPCAMRLRPTSYLFYIW